MEPISSAPFHQAEYPGPDNCVKVTDFSSQCKQKVDIMSNN